MARRTESRRLARERAERERARFASPSAIVRWAPVRGVVAYYRATLGTRLVPTAGSGAALETIYELHRDDHPPGCWFATGTPPGPVYRALRKQLRTGRGRTTVYERSA